MTSIGKALVADLHKRGVECVFGIPGVHTIELYRGLASSGIRHITPRHEQGAGFMADGYARVSGKPGVAFVIAGPGLTTPLTAMGQARADSVPMLVVSGVNHSDSLGKGLGHLHELPDQQALARTVALVSERVCCAADLPLALENAFAPFETGRSGPTHIEIPLDVAGAKALSDDAKSNLDKPSKITPIIDDNLIAKATQLLVNATAPVILVGGGARGATKHLKSLAEALDAPVVQTVNARGALFDHPLGVPASPSLSAVRDLIEAADAVLAIGTELGQTDYDMYATGTMAHMSSLIRIDCCPEQLTRHVAKVAIFGDATEVTKRLTSNLATSHKSAKGAERAEHARKAAFDEIGPEMRALVKILNAARQAIPNAIFVGDSTYPIYAGNLYYDHDRAGGWFNAATGFGSLGYGIPAALGASVADPDARVVCICGDGGAQFSLPEMMCAVDEHLPITFVIWNNHGYQEIATSMQAVDVTVVGCDPTPPDFEHIAKAHSMPFWRCTDDGETIAKSLLAAASEPGPTLIEIRAPNVAHSV
jgi:acetolactate synthase-1/2/3 large subunit